jgi:hypothetical protein
MGSAWTLLIWTAQAIYDLLLLAVFAIVALARRW